MSRIRLISQNDKTNVDVSKFPLSIYQCPRAVYCERRLGDTTRATDEDDDAPTPVIPKRRLTVAMLLSG